MPFAASKDDPASCRPVSVLPILSQVFEKPLHEAIYNLEKPTGPGPKSFKRSYFC